MDAGLDIAQRSGDNVTATPSLISARRQNISAASSRSLLLTLLGEFVHPTGKPAWTATLVSALTSLDITEKAARQALSRTAAQDIVASSRHGRRVLWEITDEGHALLEEGTQRIYSFMRGHRPWDGRWLVLSVAVPETHRQVRDKLSTRLTWLGLGSPSPTLWLSPDATKLEAVRSIVDSLGLSNRAFAWIGSETGIGNIQSLITDAWDLDTVEAQYVKFLDEFAKRQASSDTDAFIAQTQMVHAWRRFPFLDPDLPGELLSHQWPGASAANVFHAQHAQWARPAQAAWAKFAEEAGPLPT